jgi:hypothetical protein
MSNTWAIVKPLIPPPTTATVGLEGGERENTTKTLVERNRRLGVNLNIVGEQ